MVTDTFEADRDDLLVLKPEILACDDAHGDEHPTILLLQQLLLRWKLRVRPRRTPLRMPLSE
jgi:hypothetical protein